MADKSLEGVTFVIVESEKGLPHGCIRCNYHSVSQIYESMSVDKWASYHI